MPVLILLISILTVDFNKQFWGSEVTGLVKSLTSATFFKLKLRSKAKRKLNNLLGFHYPRGNKNAARRRNQMRSSPVPSPEKTALTEDTRRMRHTQRKQTTVARGWKWRQWFSGFYRLRIYSEHSWYINGMSEYNLQHIGDWRFLETFWAICGIHSRHGEQKLIAQTFCHFFIHLSLCVKYLYSYFFLRDLLQSRRKQKDCRATSENVIFSAL